MGGDEDQELTYMSDEEHDALHADLNDYLENYRNANGNTMRPSATNSAEDIQANFPPEERQAAMADFYEEYGSDYPEAARDFFGQHPWLKWRKDEHGSCRLLRPCAGTAPV